MYTITFQVWNVEEKLPEPYQLLYLHKHDNYRCIGFRSGVHDKFVEIYTGNNTDNWIDIPREDVVGWRYVDDEIEKKFREIKMQGQVL